MGVKGLIQFDFALFFDNREVENDLPQFRGLAFKKKVSQVVKSESFALSHFRDHFILGLIDLSDLVRF